MSLLNYYLVWMDGDASNGDDCDDVDVGRTECIADCIFYRLPHCHQMSYVSDRPKPTTVNYLLGKQNVSGVVML